MSLSKPVSPDTQGVDTADAPARRSRRRGTVPAQPPMAAEFRALHDVNDPTTWTKDFILSLKRDDILPLLRQYGLTPRKPFAHGGPRPRLQDQKHALLYYSGLLNEFEQGDKVIVDRDVENTDPTNDITGVVTGVRATGRGQPLQYEIELRSRGSLAKRKRGARRLMHHVAGNRLTLLWDDEIADDVTDDVDAASDSEETVPADSPLTATDEATDLFNRYGTTFDDLQTSPAMSSPAVHGDNADTTPLHPGEIARRAALEALAHSAALRLYSRFFPDDADDLARAASQAAVAACGGQLGFRRMLLDGDEVAKALLEEHRDHLRCESPPAAQNGDADSGRNAPTVVLSGAPCAGKSSIAADLKDILQPHGVSIVVVNEVATDFMLSMGPDFNPATLTEADAADFQKQLFQAQLEVERRAQAQASFLNNPLVVLDRGLIDYQAFSSPAVWETLQASLPQPLPYDNCIYLRSVATDREQLYEQSSNPARCHSVDEAKALDITLLEAWESSSVPVVTVPTTNHLHQKTAAVALHCLEARGVPVSPALKSEVEARCARRSRAQSQSVSFANPPTSAVATTARPRATAQQPSFAIDPRTGHRQSQAELQARGRSQAERFIRATTGAPSNQTVESFRRNFPAAERRSSEPSTAHLGPGLVEATASVTTAQTGAAAGQLQRQPTSNVPVPLQPSRDGVPVGLTGTSRQWYLSHWLNEFVLPRHCRSLSRSPPAAPTTASFTITSDGITSNASAAPSSPPITDMETFTACERRWKMYVLQFDPQFFSRLGGLDRYNL
eukprot:COSAG02_NODE_2495_length_8684_cov_12.735469_1_plen_788_part_00